jgi:hypothetical protein
MPPAAVHDASAAALTAQRAITLEAAFIAHPRRFKGVAPKPPALPTAAWINPPKHVSSALNGEADTNPRIQSEGIPIPGVPFDRRSRGPSYAFDFQ